MMTKEQWIESLWGDLTMGGSISKESSFYKAMIKQMDEYWEIQQSLERAVDEGDIVDVFILSEN